MFLIQDIGKPLVESSDEFPVEDVDTVTLTCIYSNQVKSYEWYKNGNKIAEATGEMYTLPGKTRAYSGSYSCQVESFAATELSDAINVTYLCKLYEFYNRSKYILVTLSSRLSQGDHGKI